MMDGIELHHVTKAFPRSNSRGILSIFRQFNLEIPRGQIVAIVGASGSGKTTLLNMIALLEPCGSGTVRIDGKQLYTHDAGRLSLGYLFQRDALLPWRTAWGNALLGLECRNRLTPECEEYAKEYFLRFGLQGFEKAWPHTLSGGQRQRVALIQNLLIDPDILLLDEPFGSLDYQTKLDMEELLLELIRPRNARRQQRTVVIVTHDIEEAIVLADRVVVIGSPHTDGDEAPTRIIADQQIELSDDLRTPIKARQSDEMKKHFSFIWESLKAGVAVDPETKRPLKFLMLDMQT